MHNVRWQAAHKRRMSAISKAFKSNQCFGIYGLIATGKQLRKSLQTIITNRKNLPIPAEGCQFLLVEANTISLNANNLFFDMTMNTAAIVYKMFKAMQASNSLGGIKKVVSRQPIVDTACQMLLHALSDFTVQRFIENTRR